MGHLDHLGIKADAKPGEDAIYNGALDNAAGVATMLEAARAVRRSAARGRAARSCSSPIPARNWACSAPIILPLTRPSRSARSSARSISTCRCCSTFHRRDRVRRRPFDHRAAVAEAGERWVSRSARPDARGSDLHPLRPLSLRRARRARGPADDRPWPMAARRSLDELSREGLSFAQRRSVAADLTGTRRRATPSSIIASRASWPTPSAADVVSRATISAICSTPGPRAPR